MIAIIDYGAGNLFSVQHALNYLGIDNKITSDKQEIINADRLILPGVGAFGDAMDKLNNSGLVDTIKKEAVKKPFLGICLGMQLLFEKSYEFGEHQGLGLIKGSVDLMKPEGNLAVPQMGWNALEYNALVGNSGTVYGAQFHPEKSGETGLNILRRFNAL